MPGFMPDVRIRPAQMSTASHAGDPQPSIIMSGSIRGISTMVVALIAVGGVAGLIALLVVIAIALDMPNRRKRKNNKSLMSAEEMEKKSVDFDDEERGVVQIKTTEAPSTSPNSPSQSSQALRTPSPAGRSGSAPILALPRLD
ncbi:hypothetical protein DDE83_000351 [Stemphylium lycopersici]|uniref:Uncharacterized protein n=1 Tax=Stemphylium lycopersici TaxID=183478 RepID=A0A364NFX2_STELY|nr:hypothetical protein DDE83_000351 [Stemphylium lycopersici]